MITPYSRGVVMDVYDVVDQVVHPLRQRGWLTYRFLKLQFKLTTRHLRRWEI